MRIRTVRARMPFLSHEGVSLRYDRAGAGPAVLLIHGWTCNRTFWERQVQALRDKHTVITVDLRGHGESSHLRTGYTLNAIVGDLEYLVRAFNLPRVAIVGWSMGGIVAQELAHRLGDKASALGLVCTTAGGLTDPKNPHAQPDRVAEMKRAMDEDFRDFIRGFAVNLFKDGAESPLFAWAVGQMQKTPAHVASAYLDTILAADQRAKLKKLKVPTAVLHGKDDALFPFEEAQALAKQIPGAELVAFKTSGHAPHLEETDAFNTALAKLLAR
jgi:pimeloyl-ACP methyl ester esterase